MAVPENLADLKAKICLDELNEKETERAGQIQCIRDWINKHPWLTCKTDDEFILGFLRVAKFILPAAQKRIETFCTVRSSEIDGEPQWFNPTDATNEKVLDYLRKGWIYKLSGLDDKGRVVIMTKFGNVNPKKIDLELLFRSSGIFFDWLLMMHEECQIGGVVLIEDGAGITLDHMVHFPHDVVKRSMKIWQDVSPMRIKEMHYINMAGFMNAILETMKLFLSQKHKERMKIHWKPQDVFKKIPKRMLPNEYGGEGGTIKQLVDATIDEIKKSAAELGSLTICRVDETKRPREEPKGDSWGMVGSFRKLNTD